MRADPACPHLCLSSQSSPTELMTENKNAMPPTEPWEVSLQPAPRPCLLPSTSAPGQGESEVMACP
jgi:hypothetical protein